MKKKNEKSITFSIKKKKCTTMDSLSELDLSRGFNLELGLTWSGLTWFLLESNIGKQGHDQFVYILLKLTILFLCNYFFSNITLFF